MIYGFFLANNADAVIEARKDKVILLHHAAGKDMGFDLFTFRIADSKTYSSQKISYEKKDKKEKGLIIVIMTNPVFYLIHHKSNSHEDSPSKSLITARKSRLRQA